MAALALFAALPGNAAAAGAFFLGTASAVGSSVGNPGQVTIDRLGNLWAVSNLHNSVVRWNGTSWTTVISGLSTPYGLAFDSANNLYVSQTGVPGVYQYPAPNYASGTKLTPSFNSPVYLAIDGSDNLFVADSGNNAIYELLASNSYATKTAVVSSGLNGPGGVALDIDGNLFVADTSNGEVKRYTASSGYTSATTIATGLNWPMGIAVDGGGDVYVSEVLNGNMDVITASSGYASLQTIFTNASTFGSRGVVIDPAGVIFEGDYGGGSVFKLSSGTVNLGSSAVGSSTTATAVTFVFGANQTGIHSAVVATGQTTEDFTINNGDPGTCGGTAASNAFTSGQSCTVKVQYAAKGLGLRTGAVELLDGGGAVVARGFVHGTGTAPLAAFSPAKVSAESMGALSPGLVAPSNPAVSADGTLYFTDGTTTGRLLRLVPGSGTPTQVATGALSLSNPRGAAVDGEGNVFVSDAGNSRVLKVAPDGTTTIVIPASAGMGNLGQVAVDASGRVYAADGANGRIVVAPPSGNVFVLPVVGATFTTPAGLAVDASYNLYVADAGSHQLFKVAYGIASQIDTSALTTALNAPNSLSVDTHGTLFVSDTGNHRIVQVPASGGPSVLNYTHTTALVGPIGVAINGRGQMTIADTGNNALTKLDWTTAVHGFATATTGVTSMDSPASFSFFNLGNTSLTLAVPGSGSNPSISDSAFTQSVTTTCPVLSSASSPAALAPLASCVLAFDFQPTAGGLASGTASYVSDSLNVAASVSLVSLSGTGLAAGDTTTLTFGALPATLFSGQSATVSVTVANSTTPATVPTGTVSFSDSIQGALGSATLNGAGVASLGSVTFTGAGTHVITASYGGVPSTFLASSNTASIPVSGAIGACGSAQSVPSAFAPSGAALCSAGAASAVNSASGTYTWTCTGSGAPQACSAPWSAVGSGAGTGTAAVSGGGGGAWAFTPSGVGSLDTAGFIPVSGHAKSPGDTPPSGVTFPYGLFDFVLTGGDAGSTAQISITFPNPLPAGTQYWKYGPTAADNTPHWYVLPAGQVSFSPDRRTVTLSIADGGLGDDEVGGPNGRIIDAGGPGVPAATGIPTLSEWALALLAALIGLATLVASRRPSVRLAA
ncbi:MAG: IPTL-CTERM sorting domain-containing protein [Rhodocyclaceae bacterium]|nr:IPTL-CTERM sorting domain-containing protein [Rhodocyclaceae bacterium]